MLYSFVFLNSCLDGHKKQQAQRFTLPYFMSEDRIKVTYEKNREGGTLSIIMTKPGIGSGSSSGPVWIYKFDLNNLFLRLVVSLHPLLFKEMDLQLQVFFLISFHYLLNLDDKVTMGAAQTASYFSFTAQGSCKFDTEMTGELTNGSTIKFHATVTDTVLLFLLKNYLFLGWTGS